MATAAECIFCKVASGQVPAQVVAQNEWGLVFADLNPQAPLHWLGIPRKHLESLDAVADEAWTDVMKTLELLQKTAKEKNLPQNGYRVVNNMGQHGGQTVYHLHFHLLGGRHMTWPPG